MKKINENIKLIIVLIMAIVISSMISIKAATTLSSTSVYYDTSKSGGSSSNVNGAIDELYSLTTDRDKLKTDILNLTYPVGSIYMSTEDDTVEKVQERFGGTWERYAEGTMLMSVDSNHAVNTTGGSSSVTLSESNLPSHSHVIPSLNGNTNESGEHTHNFEYNNGSYVSALKYGTAFGNYLNFASGNSIGYNISIQKNGLHTHVVTTTESNTTTCTNCSGTSFSVQNPYTAIYMYKRIS